MMELTKEQQEKYDSYKKWDITQEEFNKLPEYSMSDPTQDFESGLGVKVWKRRTPINASDDDALWFVGVNDGPMNNFYTPNFISKIELPEDVEVIPMFEHLYGSHVCMNDRFSTHVIWSEELAIKNNGKWTPELTTKILYDKYKD